jgi:RNase P subunit RPR2
MSDRYLIEPICKKCKADLSEELPLFISDEDKIVLTCEKCGARTKYWCEMKINSKLLKGRKLK